MMTGNKNPGYTGKYARKRRFSGKSLALLVSALVLSFSMVGGTLAWLSDDTGPITNTLTMPRTDITIEEEFDGAVKKDVRVKNNGDVPVYVRVTLNINWQDSEHNVHPGIALGGNHFTIHFSQSAKWVLNNGIYYYLYPLAPGKTTDNLIDSITLLDDPDVPEGCTLVVDVLAQSVQSQGMKDDAPMVEAQGWPVTVQSDGSLALN